MLYGKGEKNITDLEFHQRFLTKLNSQQLAAVTQTEGPVLLLAVPGSGKTTVLIHRLGYLVFCRGIAPERILTVTYTVAATRDMRERFSAVFGEEYANRLTFRTINGICAVVVGYYAAWKGTEAFELATDEKAINAVIRDVLVKGGNPFPGDQLIKEARTQITYCKNMMLTEEQIRAHKVDGMDFPAVYAGYQSYLKRNRLMDYDDQMVFTYRIFRQYPQILERFRQRYTYLCVDEAQDTSKIQHAILRLLAAPANNLFMVGDEDQSIYGFRAAWPQALLDFEQTYPGAKVLLMETNYRSTGQIVQRADAFIQRNRDRHPKRMHTDNELGEPVRKIELGDYNRQYNYLLKVAREGSGQTAVLFRNNDSALPLIDLLEREKIPYACRQREAFFFSSPVVRDLTDMLEFAFQDGNAELFLRFYYKLDLKIKKTVVAPILQNKGWSQSVFDALISSAGLEGWQVGKVRAMQTHFAKLPSLNSYAALQRLVRYLGYGDYLEDQHGDTAKLDILMALANQTPDLKDFLHRLKELKTVVEEQVSPPGCQFILSTIHASKGLEYDRVILMDVLDGIFPSVEPPANEEAMGREERATLEEERRLFYVAATRARHQLDLLTYRGKFGESGGTRSTFIIQLLGEERTGGMMLEKQKKTLAAVPTPKTEDIAAWEREFQPGTVVKHKRFGKGVLESRAGSIAVIDFGEHGIKKLDLTTCLRSRMIQKEK